MVSLDGVQKGELFARLKAAIDGIDGYESEHGDLMYWDEARIERSPQLIDKLSETA